MSDPTLRHIAARALRPATRETTDLTIRSMLALFALIGASLLALIFVAYLLFPKEIHDNRFALPAPHFPAPRLQPSPPLDMAAFYAAEMHRLNTPGWIDRARGIVHIPIGQAMRRIAAQGIPGWPTSPAASEGSRR